MANLVSLARRGRRSTPSIESWEDYQLAMSQFMYNGLAYAGIQTTMGEEQAETIGNSFAAYAHAYATNGIIFACMAVRMDVFSSARFQFQRMRNGRPGELWGNSSLGLLETPWSGGTTQDLLGRMIQDADLSGNSYWTTDPPGRAGTELVRLRPDWMSIVLRKRMIRGNQVGYKRIGYLYWEGGNRDQEPAAFTVEEVVHFAPRPDPLATYRGMSWLTPVLREIENDNLMQRHKRKFFENAATPNVIVRMDPTIIKTPEVFKKFKAEMDSQHKGVEDAYKTLYLAGAADTTVAGTDFKQMDFKAVQGAGETRIASAAGVHPVIVGLSEGLQGSALNAGNYGQVRKRFANGTMHPLWGNGAGSMQRIVTAPADSRLWYDARDIPFLQEDTEVTAKVALTRSSTIAQYVREGFTPESAIAAVDADDITLLVHTGKVSVQLQEPGALADAEDDDGSDDASTDDDQQPSQDEDDEDDTDRTRRDGLRRDGNGNVVPFNRGSA